MNDLTLDVAIQYYDNLIKYGSPELTESYKFFKKKLEERVNMSQGLRYNKGKLPVHLVPPSTTRALAEVLKYGANKYEERNWEKGMSWETVMGCAERHFLAFKDNSVSDIDDESGLPHLYHAACNLMMLIEYMHTHPNLDDRKKSLDLKVSSIKDLEILKAQRVADLTLHSNDGIIKPLEVNSNIK